MSQVTMYTLAINFLDDRASFEDISRGMYRLDNRHYCAFSCLKPNDEPQYDRHPQFENISQRTLTFRLGDNKVDVEIWTNRDNHVLFGLKPIFKANTFADDISSDEQHLVDAAILGCSAIEFYEYMCNGLGYSHPLGFNVLHLHGVEGIFAALYLVHRLMVHDKYTFKQAIDTVQQITVFSLPSISDQSFSIEAIMKVGANFDLTMEQLSGIAGDDNGRFNYKKAVQRLSLKCYVGFLPDHEFPTESKMLMGATVDYVYWQYGAIRDAFEIASPDSVYAAHVKAKERLVELTGFRLDPTKLIISINLELSSGKMQSLECLVAEQDVQVIFYTQKVDTSVNQLACNYPKNVVVLTETTKDILLYLVRGSDLWFDNPRNSLGRRAAANGVLIISHDKQASKVSNGDNGWILSDDGIQQLFERTILPTFRNRWSWSDMMMRAIKAPSHSRCGVEEHCWKFLWFLYNHDTFRVTT